MPPPNSVCCGLLLTISLYLSVLILRVFGSWMASPVSILTRSSETQTVVRAKCYKRWHPHSPTLTFPVVEQAPEPQICNNNETLVDLAMWETRGTVDETIVNLVNMHWHRLPNVHGSPVFARWFHFFRNFGAYHGTCQKQTEARNSRAVLQVKTMKPEET